jgi:hypothetical protein
MLDAGRAIRFGVTRRASFGWRVTKPSYVLTITNVSETIVGDARQ